MAFKINPIGLPFDQVEPDEVRPIVNGSIKESFDALCASDGATVTMSLEQKGGGDLTLLFSDGETVIDCTPAQTIALTAGADNAPQENYVYIPQSTKVLTVSTSGFPATEHTKVGYFFVPSASHVQDEGCYINQNWNDHLKGTDEMGHLLHISEHIRRSGAKYFSGIDPNGLDQDTNTSYFDYVAADEAYFKAGSGVIYQLHQHAIPAVDTATAGDDIHVINWSGDNYFELSNLADITEDSEGNSLSNSYFNLFFFAVGNKGGEYAPTMCQLPSGSYSSQTSAENDVDGHDNLQMPREFALESSTGTPICRMTLRWTGGTTSLSHISTVDLRSEGVAASGGATGTTTSFADNQFEVFNVADNTKLLEFDVSAVSTGQTSTLTVPDADGTIALTSDLDSYLKLDTTNDPLTGDLEISKASPTFTLADTSGNSADVSYDGSILKLDVPADEAQLSAQPTGGTDLAISTTKYVDDEIAAIDLTPYAKLDGTNQPFTGDLQVDKTTPVITLTDDTNDYDAVISKENTSNEFKITNQVSVPGAGGSSTLGDNLISYYKFDVSGSFPDEVGTSPGAIDGATFNASGKINGDYIFDGINDKIRIANQAPFNFGTGDCTFSCWFKTTQGTGNPQLISTNWASATACGIDMNNGQVRALMLTGSGTTIPKSPLTYADGAWHLATAVVDKTAGLNRIYVDGDEKDSVATHGGSLTTTVDYGVGDGVGTGNNWRGLEFQGELDEIGIWNRALTPSEITELYNSGAGKTHPFTGGGGGPAIEVVDVISSIDGSVAEEMGVVTVGDEEGKVVLAPTNANSALLSEQPTGEVDLAIATTAYVDTVNKGTCICTATEEVGDLVYVSASGTVSQADASDISTSQAIGIITEKDGDTSCTVTFSGRIEDLSGLTAGYHYFLSETPGQITDTAPTTSGSVLVNVGIALTSTELILNISNVYTIRS